MPYRALYWRVRFSIRQSTNARLSYFTMSTNLGHCTEICVRCLCHLSSHVCCNYEWEACFFSSEYLCETVMLLRRQPTRPSLRMPSPGLTRLVCCQRCGINVSVAILSIMSWLQDSLMPGFINTDYSQIISYSIIQLFSYIYH